VDKGHAKIGFDGHLSTIRVMIAGGTDDPRRAGDG
jgi:hypothetical protein